MAGKPPTSVKAPAKATFKHSLPQTLGEAYFHALNQHVTKDIPDYHNEYDKVCYDVLQACHMASTGFSPEANLGPATANVATGKCLYSPQRDQYNGPLQAFLQHPLSALGRPSVWQHWVKNRDMLVEDFSLFAKKCFRSEAKIVDAPQSEDTQAGSPLGSRGRSASFHGGMLSPPNGLSNNSFGSFNTSFNSSPNMRSPNGGVPGSAPSPNNASNPASPNGGGSQRKLSVRPGTAQATTREASSNDTFIRCGTNSFFDPERLVLVHIWANPRAARTFVQSWRRLAQITFEHRLDMIHCPISVVNCIESTFVSVTALPPVMDSVKSPPLRNVGARSSGDGFESLIQRMGHQLLEVLASDSCDNAHTKGNGLTLYPGVDGRYYLMSLHFNLHPKFQEKDLNASVQPRPELVYLKVENKMFEETFDQVLMEHALPKALRQLHDLLNDPSFTVDVVIRDGLVSLAFHQLGINMKCLGRALSMVDNNTLGLPNAVAIAQLRVILITEMVGRTFKHLMRLDCQVGAAGTQADRDLVKTCNNTRLRLSVVNRLARFAVAKDAEFFSTQVLPILRQKFSMPSDWTTDWKEVNPGTCLKILSSKLGCEFGAAEGRFHKFVESSSKDLVMLACNAPLEAVLCEDREAGHVATNQFWTQCLSIPSDSTLYESYLIRACAMSVITNAHLGRIPVQLVDGTGQAEANAMAPVFLLQLAGVLFEHQCKEGKVVTAATRFLAALRDHMVEVDSRRSSGNTVTPEATYNSLKHIAAAPLVEKYQLVAKAPSDLDSSKSTGSGLPSPLSARTTETSASGQAVDPSVLENGVKYFVDQPHVDFTFSSLHSQAVRDLESMIPLMTQQQLEHFLSETVESVADNLNRADRRLNATRYYQRVAIQLVGVSTAEKSFVAAKMMRETYSMSVRQFGIDDARTSVALYLQCLFALKSSQTASSPPSVGTAANQCKKIYDKAMTLGPVDQKAFYQTATVFTVLQRVLVALDLVHDSTSATTLKPHIKLLTNLHGAMMMIQKSGRGFIVRKRRTNKFENAPAPPAKLPSLGIAPGVLLGAGTPIVGSAGTPSLRSTGSGSLPGQQQHGFGYSSFAIPPGGLNSFLQAQANQGPVDQSPNNRERSMSSSGLGGMPPLPPPPPLPPAHTPLVSNPSLGSYPNATASLLTNHSMTRMESSNSLKSPEARSTTSQPTPQNKQDSTNSPDAHSQGMPLNMSFSGNNSFTLPKGPPPLPPVLQRQGSFNASHSGVISPKSPKSEGTSSEGNSTITSPQSRPAVPSDTAPTPRTLSRVQFTPDLKPAKAPQGGAHFDAEVVVESLDDDDDAPKKEELENLPAMRALRQRSYTFSRGGSSGGLGAGRLRSNSSFSSPTGGVQASNSEFGVGTSSGQSSGVFSPTHRTARRRLTLEGSVNLDQSPPNGSFSGGSFGSGFNGGLQATGATQVIAGRRAGQVQQGSPSGPTSPKGGYGKDLDVELDDEDDEDHNESLFRLCDQDEDGLVSADDCAQVFTRFTSGGLSEAQLRTLFTTATKNSKQVGKLNKKEFGIFVTRAGL